MYLHLPQPCSTSITDCAGTLKGARVLSSFFFFELADVNIKGCPLVTVHNIFDQLNDHDPSLPYLETHQPLTRTFYNLCSLCFGLN